MSWRIRNLSSVLLWTSLLIGMVAGCISWVDLGPSSSSTRKKPAVTAQSPAAAVCCVTIEWSFQDDNEPPIAGGEAVTFQLSIDGVDRPQFAQTITVATARRVVDLRFSTVIPKEMFFDHALVATLVRPALRLKNGRSSMTLTHGFQLGDQS